MKNTTKIKLPKKYQNIIKELCHDSDGYWCYLEKGWRNWDDYGLHIIHEDTQQELLEKIRKIVPCDCDQCKGRLWKI